MNRATASAVAAVVLVSIALVLQVSVFDDFAWHGIVPDLALLVVVGAGLARGSQFGMVVGFTAGVLADLTPPADHLAGRWALALLLVGLLAGRVRAEVRPDVAPTATTVMATVFACSFVGTSLFALTGLVLRDPAAGTGELLSSIGISLIWDLLLAPLVLPLVLTVFRRLEPAYGR